jgi:hypothetical protein
MAAFNLENAIETLLFIERQRVPNVTMRYDVLLSSIVFVV